MISIIIPVLNEAGCIEASLARLQVMRRHGHEIIIVDAGSSDATLAIAAPLVDQVLTADQGRAMQMNRGAEHARGNILWFLHADTLVPENAESLIESAVDEPLTCWGRFDVRLSGRHWLLTIIALMMNLRSCVTGIATGDQGIFISRELFQKVGAYPCQPLMEDIELSQRLKRFSRPKCIHAKLITSSRRWEQNGIVRTILLMWYLRLRYALGGTAENLARKYYP